MSVNSVEIKVEGDLSFEMKVDGERVEWPVVKSGKETEIKAGKKDDSSEETERVVEKSNVVKAEMKANEREYSNDEMESAMERNTIAWLSIMTPAAPVECVYQYPEKPQVESLLSNMMNQLAKVYTKVREFVSVAGAGVGRGGWGRRGRETRFRVVTSPNLTFFDEIYANMTDEYRNLYDNTTYIVPRTADPCVAQPVLKVIWGHLIDSSIAVLRTAVARSVGHIMEVTPLPRRKRTAVRQLVESEMTRVRASQLDTLCDEFQLCFNELL